MELIITTNDCKTSDGFAAIKNPAAVALQRLNPELENVKFSHNRLTATRSGYPVRFALKNFTIVKYKDLMYGTQQSCTCTLEALPVRVSVNQRR